MNGKKLIFIIFISFLSLISISTLINSLNFKSSKFSLNTNASSQSHEAIFFDERLFFKGLTEAEENYIKPSYQISGGIIPHDFFPGFILSDFYKKLSEQDVKTVILLGPNHYEKGSSKFLTSAFDWKTPFGVVNSDKDIIKNLLDEKILEVDEEVLPKDHSVGSSLAYIKYYLPDAKVVPILISGFTTQKEAEEFSNILSKLVGDDIVLVSAVDFSHYLGSEEAHEKDKVTYKYIKNRNYEQIFNLNNDNTDSPASIAVTLMTMDEIGKSKMEALYNTNSGVLQDEKYIETTSYFSIVFY